MNCRWGTELSPGINSFRGVPRYPDTTSEAFDNFDKNRPRKDSLSRILWVLAKKLQLTFLTRGDETGIVLDDDRILSLRNKRTFSIGEWMIFMKQTDAGQFS